MKTIDGGITTPKGFKATGFFGGIRRKKEDMSIIYSEVPANCVAVFTKNTVKAAPILLDMEILKRTNLIQAIVINSGNANSCTGERGLKDAETMIETVKDVLDLENDRVLVSSTGVIGSPLPIEKITNSIKTNYKRLGNTIEDSDNAAEAIMTTDTFKKKVSVEIEIGGKRVVIAGIAKGSGMIHPNMGTMLAYITTDINISHSLLDELLKESIKDSYKKETLDKIGKDTDFIDGLRVTDSETMEIVEMVLSGRVNKEIVNSIESNGISSVGISGKDGNILTAKKKQIENGDLEFVGDIVSVDTSLIKTLFEKGIISGGMIPKVECCMKAVENGTKQVHIIDGRMKHSMILEIFTDKGIGTMFVKGGNHE